MGRRRRYRSREVADPLELEQLLESRKAAYLGKKHDKEHEDQIESSNGFKAAEREVKLECAAILRNIPKNIAASELVQTLSQRAGFQDEIIKCNILTESGSHHRSNGSALIVFKTPAAFQKITDLCKRGLRIQGLEVSIKEKTNWQRGGSRADSLKVFPVIKMHLCVGDRDLQCLEPSVVRWFCSRDVSLQINPRNDRQIAIEFDSQFRIEFPLKSIRQSRLLRNADGREVYRFRLGGPPHVFVRDSTLDSHHASGMLANILRGMKTDKRVWELGGSSGADHKWERTIDPTRFSAFGHCLVYELVFGQTPFNLTEVLSHFSITPPVVPGVIPDPIETEAIVSDGNWSGGYDDVFESLPFPIQYMLHACIASHKLCLRNRQAAQTLYDALANEEIDLEKTVEELENWYFDGYPTRFHELLEHLSTTVEPDSHPELLDKDPRRSALTRRVLITPLRICPLPLDVDTSNRVLRSFWRYRDRFLRVNFCDEDFGSVMQVVRSPDVMERRIRQFVHDGIVIGGRRFVFLAYSNSQLREQSCWMYDEDYRDDDDDDFPSAAEIRESIGDLSHISVVGKHAARLAQAFSSTTAAVRMVDWQYELIDDVERNGFCFSDGCGVLSITLAEKIAAELNLTNVPSAFQIRFGGSKGIVGVRPFGALNIPDVDLVLRPSMTKFVANEAHRDLEVCNYSKIMPCYLNRQIIILLSALGIPDRSFLDLADAVLKSMDHAMSDYDCCCEMVRDNAPGSVADRMLDAGIKPEHDRHLWELVHALRDRLLMDVQTKARIFVHQGLTLYGVMDETGLLDPDEIFFQQSNPPMMLPPGTRVAVGRSPCLHPGDIRVLRTSDCPELSNLYDVIVFSQQGERPQPNMMSGGDLDGDIYFIIWDDTLIPTEEYPPMDYAAAPAQQPLSVSDHVDVSHIQDFFVNYMKNDNLGRIANAHVVFADRAEEGAKSAECLSLAELHSIAVDFGKTGVPALLPKEYYPHAYPDFMEKETKPSYDSKKVIGKIYRKARGRHFKPFPPHVNGFDERFLVSGYDEFVHNARDLFVSYSNSLWDIAQRFECYDEGELVSGFVRSLTKKLARTRDVTGVDSVQQLTMQVEHMMEGYREEFWNGLDRDITNPESYQRALAKASAWYFVAYSQPFVEEFDKPFLSFAWVATSQMCAIVQSALGDRQE